MPDSGEAGGGRSRPAVACRRREVGPVSLVTLLLARDRVDLLTDTLASDADRRPRGLASKVATVPTGSGLALVAAIGTNSLLPAMLHSLSAAYLRDVRDAVPLAARQLSCVVGAEAARFGDEAGRG